MWQYRSTKYLGGGRQIWAGDCGVEEGDGGSKNDCLQQNLLFSLMDSSASSIPVTNSSPQTLKWGPPKGATRLPEARMAVVAAQQWQQQEQLQLALHHLAEQQKSILDQVIAAAQAQTCQQLWDWLTQTDGETPGCP